MVWHTSLRWNLKHSENPDVLFLAEKYGENPLDLDVPFDRLMNGETHQVSRRFENKVNQVPHIIATLEARQKEAQEQLTELRVMVKEPWARADELTDMQQRLEAVTEELEAEATVTPVQQEAEVAPNVVPVQRVAAPTM